MWIESLPFAPWGIPNLPVSPGDSVSVDIFVADENGDTHFQDGWNGGLTSADNSVWFMIYNYSRGESFWDTLGTAPYSQNGFTSTGYTGSTAEFVIERPSDDNGNPYPLATFASAVMNSCWYADALYGNKPWALGPDGSTPFDGQLSYLNMINQANNDLLAVPISLPDPTNPPTNQMPRTLLDGFIPRCGWTRVTRGMAAAASTVAVMSTSTAEPGVKFTRITCTAELRRCRRGNLRG